MKRNDATARTAVLLAGLAIAGTASAADIKGAAILDHPCGKVAVKHMGLMHAGKVDEANKLSTKEMRISGRRCRPRIAR